MKTARAEVVAVIEDHCLTAAGWAEQVLRAHAQNHDVVAGPLENASRDSLFDWAFFLLEYGSSMPPLASGQGAAIPGVNISYKKAALPLEDERFAELWESFLIDELRRRGARIHIDARMLIHHRNPYSFREFAVQKYLYSRSFAAMRVSDKGRAVRFAFAGFAVTVLPLLLLMRLIRTVWAKKRNRSELLLALPMIGVLVCCGAAGKRSAIVPVTGEACGRFGRRAGTPCRKKPLLHLTVFAGELAGFVVDQVGVHEAAEIAVEHAVDIAAFQFAAQVFDQAIRGQHVVSNLAAEINV